MAVKAETSLQQRIQKLIRSKGGYVHKNWGNMITAAGIADLTVCYKGIYLAIEVKEGSNKPSSAQGIHCRNVQKAGGLTAIVWSTQQVELILSIIDNYFNVSSTISDIKSIMLKSGVDDGTRW